VWEVEVRKDAVVEAGTVFTSPREPGHDGGVAMPEHANRGSDI
jgi:hypothetical protein